MVLRYIVLFLFFLLNENLVAQDLEYKKVENKRFKKIQKTIEKKRFNSAYSKLEIIYKTTKRITTKIKALFFMAKIKEHTGDISKALNFYLYIQKTSQPEIYSNLKKNINEELELDDLFDDLPSLNAAFIKALELEVSLFFRLNNFSAQGLATLELLKRKSLLLIESESRLTFLDEILDKIDKQKVEINRKVKKNFFWAGMAQNFFSKNFDIASVTSTIPMSYTGYGPKFSIGYSRESYYRGWMIGGGFSSIFGELSIESSGQTSVDYFVKRKNFYIMDGQFTYYIRPYGGESKFGLGLDLAYIAYTLSLPGELTAFEEKGLSINAVPHFLYEFEKKWIIFFSKLGLITPGSSMQFEIGGKLNF